MTIAGQTVTPAYAGRTPLFAGEDQIDFVLPDNVVTGCYTPVEISVAGQASISFCRPIGTGEACTHPLGLDAASLAKLDAGGTVNAGVFLMLTAGWRAAPCRAPAADFRMPMPTPLFKCSSRFWLPLAVILIRSQPDPAPFRYQPIRQGIQCAESFGIGGTVLDAGPAVTFNGKRGVPGARSSVAGVGDGRISILVLRPLDPRSWTVSGTGGKDCRFVFRHH